MSGHPCRCGHAHRLHFLGEFHCQHRRCACQSFRRPVPGPVQLELAPVLEQLELVSAPHGCEHAAPQPCAACVTRVRPLGGAQ